MVDGISISIDVADYQGSVPIEMKIHDERFWLRIEDLKYMRNLIDKGLAAHKKLTETKEPEAKKAGVKNFAELEVGATYLNREGEKVTINSDNKKPEKWDYRFGSGNNSYTVNGAYYSNNHDHPFDLIELIEE